MGVTCALKERSKTTLKTITTIALIIIVLLCGCTEEKEQSFPLPKAVANSLPPSESWETPKTLA